MKIKLVLIAAACFTISACSNNGPLKIGKDTYSISNKVLFSGSSGAKGDALKTANEYCQSQGKQVLLKSQSSSECMLKGGCGEADTVFMCLNENDPRYLNKN